MAKAKAKTLTLADIAGVLNTKPLAEEVYTDSASGLRFKFRALSEAESAYLGMEIAKLGNDEPARATLASICLAISLGLKAIDKEVDGKWTPVDLALETYNVLGEQVQAIPLQTVMGWDLERVKKPIGERVMELTQLAGGEALKLELFR